MVGVKFGRLEATPAARREGFWDVDSTASFVAAGGRFSAARAMLRSRRGDADRQQHQRHRDQSNDSFHRAASLSVDRHATKRALARPEDFRESLNRGTWDYVASTAYGPHTTTPGGPELTRATSAAAVSSSRRGRSTPRACARARPANPAPGGSRWRGGRPPGSPRSSTPPRCRRRPAAPPWS